MGDFVVNALDCGKECLGCGETLGEGLLEVSCGCVACVIGHCRDGEWKVALYEDRRPPPFCPGVVSSGVGLEFWGADGVECRYGGDSRVLEDECVGLGLESEGVIFDF